MVKGYGGNLVCWGWLLLAAPGCHALLEKKPPRDYRTVVTPPNRDPDKAADLNQKAEHALKSRKPEKAEALLQEALIADVTYGPAHNNLGFVYFERGELYLAAWEFEYAARLMPNFSEVQNNLGLVYEAVDQYAEAAVRYRRALEQLPDSPVYLANLTRVLYREDDKNPEIDLLLPRLIMLDSRPEWQKWARELQARRVPRRSLSVWSQAETLPSTLPPGSEPHAGNSGPVLMSPLSEPADHAWEPPAGEAEPLPAPLDLRPAGDSPRTP